MNFKLKMEKKVNFSDWKLQIFMNAFFGAIFQENGLNFSPFRKTENRTDFVVFLIFLEFHVLVFHEQIKICKRCIWKLNWKNPKLRRYAFCYEILNFWRVNLKLGIWAKHFNEDRKIWKSSLRIIWIFRIIL